MFDKLNIFQMAMGLATHSAARQSTIAQNVANADTPGYRARDLPGFSESYEAPGDRMAQRATRPAHVMEGDAARMRLQAQEVIRPGAESPNGNTVSLETEMLNAAEVRRHHEMSLSVYKTSLNIMRMSVRGSQ